MFSGYTAIFNRFMNEYNMYIYIYTYSGHTAEKLFKLFQQHLNSPKARVIMYTYIAAILLSLKKKCMYVYIYISIYLSVCLSIYLSVCLSIYLSIPIQRHTAFINAENRSAVPQEHFSFTRSKCSLRSLSGSKPRCSPSSSHGSSPLHRCSQAIMVPKSQMGSW